MTFFEKYLNKQPLGKWLPIKTMPPGTGLAAILQAVKTQPLSGYLVQVNDLWEMFRIVPAPPEKIKVYPGNGQNQMQTLLVCRHQITIMHDFKRIGINNCIPIPVATLRRIIEVCKRKHGVGEDYEITIN